MESRRRLLYFAPESQGGLADYAQEQARALLAAGVELCLLAPADLAENRSRPTNGCRAILRPPPDRAVYSSRFARRLKTARTILSNIRVLAREIRRGNYEHVLFGWYFEYFAPIWAPGLRRLARRGKVFGAVVHDPVRDFVLGPLWWHRWSTACGYSFLREAFVHESVHLPTVRFQPQLRTTVIPHGPYRFSPATVTRKVMRERFKIPQQAPLLLAFGHIRDAKNLDLALEAMAACPQYYLLVAGRELGAAQRPVSHYQQLAKKLGVDDRCRWDIRHIPQDEVGNLFEAVDLVLLTYNANFSSASGVLNVACQFRKPSLASGGKSNLRTVLERFSLGYWVEPDSAASIISGLKKCLGEKPLPDWGRYEEENSWNRNAQIIVSRLFDN